MVALIAGFRVLFPGFTIVKDIACKECDPCMEGRHDYQCIFEGHCVTCFRYTESNQCRLSCHAD